MTDGVKSLRDDLGACTMRTLHHSDVGVGVAVAIAVAIL